MISSENSIWSAGLSASNLNRLFCTLPLLWDLLEMLMKKVRATALQITYLSLRAQSSHFSVGVRSVYVQVKKRKFWFEQSITRERECINAECPLLAHLLNWQNAILTSTWPHITFILGLMIWRCWRQKGTHTPPVTNFKPYSLSLSSQFQIKRTQFSLTSQLKNVANISITDQIDNMAAHGCEHIDTKKPQTNPKNSLGYFAIKSSAPRAPHSVYWYSKQKARVLEFVKLRYKSLEYVLMLVQDIFYTRYTFPVRKFFQYTCQLDFVLFIRSTWSTNLT